MFDEKPMLQNSKTRFGMKSGHTIKYDYYSQSATTKPTTFRISDAAVEYNKRHNPEPKPQYYWQREPQYIPPSVSINKNKGWEELERMKQDPAFIVFEDYNFIKPIDKEYQNYMCRTKINFTKEEEKLENTKIVQGRKGKEIKMKREKGKKGVKKNIEKENQFEDVEFIVDVQPTEPKQGKAFLSGGDGHWKKGYQNRNRTFRKRREDKKNCELW